MDLARELAKRLAAAIGSRDDVLVVASTDLSHFHNSTKAEELDARAASLIAKIDAEGIYEAEQKGSCELCGIMPVTTVLSLASEFKKLKSKVLSYAHSGKITGDNSSVVGYLSAVLF